MGRGPVMDFQTLKLTYDALPPAAKAVCAKVEAAVFGKVLGGAWSAGAQRTPGAVFAGIYRQWRDDLLETEADVAKIQPAIDDVYAKSKPVVLLMGRSPEQ